MYRRSIVRNILLVFFLLSVVTGQTAGQEDQGGILWSWRGPSGNGLAPNTSKPPVEWSAEEKTNILWSVDVPGRGHASPMVADGKIFLATADDAQMIQSVVCFDYQTGQQLWETVCNEGGFLRRIFPTNSHASSTVAFGAGHAFAVFCNRDSVQVVALTTDGEIVWNKVVGKFIPTQYQFGNGQSPIFHDGKLIITSETETDAFVLALNPADGSEIWRIDRAAKTSYSTPVVATLDGREQLILGGGDSVSGYDLTDGKELWTVPSKWRVSCGTAVWSQKDNMIFVSGGYPAQQTMGIVLKDGKASIAWENGVKCYEQSMIVVDDCLYGYADGGVLYCWDTKSGEELWKKRLARGEAASPIHAGGNIYFTSEQGTTWVIRANRTEYDEVSVNQLGEEMYASIAVVGDNLLMRVANGQGEQRRETLYCLGKKQVPANK